MTAAALAVWGAALAASLLLSPAVLRYARRRALLDIPTERSSHTQPTPRGGGLGLVLVILGGVALVGGAGWLDREITAAVLGGGVVVAIVGWMDDVRGLSATLRLACHTLAAVWTVFWLGGLPTLVVGESAAVLGGAGALLAVASIVWATNLYNFMDGIDGLAAAEAATVGAVAAGLLASRHPALGLVTSLVAGAAAGFLPWNWQRARIFMGDVGSGFLGFVFATVALASENRGALPALVWLLLLGVFFADATITLIRRLVRREPWHAAHRSHAYQRAVQSGWTHGQVVGAVLAVNGVLALLAWMGAEAPARLPLLVLLAGAVLGALYLAVERRVPMRMENSTR